MAIFDRFLNPAWHKISSLRPQEIFEVSVVICLHGYLRKVLCEEFVVPLEKLCDPHAPKELLNGPFGSILRGIQRLWPLNTELRERLIDEVEIGFLTCVKGKPVGNLRFEVLNDSEVIEGIGCLALAEINTRLSRKRPSSLNEAGYSQEPDECRTQVILSWLRLANLQNSELPGFLSSMFFERRWKTACEDVLTGGAIGFGRTDWKSISARARQDCKQLSPKGTAMVDYLASGIEKRRNSTKAQPPELLKEKEKGLSEFRMDHPLCFMNPKALLGIIQLIATKTDSWHRRLKIFSNPDSFAIKYDCKDYAYCTVLSVLENMEPKFRNCGVHKEIEKLFGKEEHGEEYFVYLISCPFTFPQYFQMFALKSAGGADAVGLATQLKVGIDVAIRKTAWDCAQHLNSFTTPPVEKLFSITNILQKCWATPTLRQPMTELATENLNIAKEEINKLKTQFLEIEHGKCKI